jgi:hypothetical protein
MDLVYFFSYFSYLISLLSYSQGLKRLGLSMDAYWLRLLPYLTLTLLSHLCFISLHPCCTASLALRLSALRLGSSLGAMLDSDSPSGYRYESCLITVSPIVMSHWGCVSRLHFGVLSHSHLISSLLLSSFFGRNSHYINIHSFLPIAI